MIQLLSTEELKKWLANNKKVVDDPSVETVMITNMTRVENGLKVEKAGVHAL
jgi:Ran GTPase-activating protein (RanGAP) involved in mRNA processing and transport